MPLTDARCRSEPPQAKLKKLVDGGGLQLWVQPSGARLWRLAYRFAGKQKLFALGVYPSVPLAKARQARDEAKRLLAQGLDPSNERKQRAQAKANAPTFCALADEYLAKLNREARADATLNKTEWLLAFAKDEFGDVPIADVSAPMVLRVLQRLEARERYEFARRLR